MGPDPALAAADYCYLTTTGRVSGRPREIEIWFGLADGRLYLLSGGRDRSNWVKNLMRDPTVSVRLEGRRFAGRARIVEDADEEALARRLLFDKYSTRDPDDLTGWSRTALPVAIDFEDGS